MQHKIKRCYLYTLRFAIIGGAHLLPLDKSVASTCAFRVPGMEILS